MSDSLVGVALLAVCGLCNAAAPATERDPNTAGAPVMVVLYTIPSLSDRMLDRALEESSEVFENAGVEIGWTVRRRSNRETEVLDNPVQREFAEPDPACAEFPPGACVLAQISDRLPETFAERALGVSRPYGKNRGMVRVTVLYNRVTKMASRMGLPVSRLLGAVLTHELGHVLSGTDAHGEGLMRASWTLDDFHDLCQGLLFFDSAEVRLMHMHLGASVKLREPEPDETAPTHAGHP